MTQICKKITSFFLLLILAAFCAYRGYRAGYRNGLIYSSMQFLEHFDHCKFMEVK